MLTRTALALLLLFPAAASAQELDAAISAVVRISGTRGGTPVRGSGFVVVLDGGQATIVTASHVIEGMPQFEVTFAAEPTQRFPVDSDSILGMDSGSPNGLAAFQVRGALPAGVTTLCFEIKSRPRNGEELFLVGFPQMELAPRTPRRVLSGWRGMLLLVDQEIGEGFSGGPVLQGGKVVGVITEMDDQTTYAVGAVVVREALEGWRVKLGGQCSPPVPPVVEKCEPGKGRNEYGIVFVRICAGTFTMGSAENDPHTAADEKPAHQVTLSEFWISMTEITNEQYRHFKPNHQYKEKARGKDELPATDVSWDEAVAACEHFGGHLPTEAQWEYAARAGKQTTWSTGSDVRSLFRYAWYDKRSVDDPRPVGKKKANAWGLYDMDGNVREWVEDWYALYEKGPQTDPAGPKTGQLRVVRGGAYFDSPWLLRSAYRNGVEPGGRLWFIGFRCARSPGRQP